MLWKTAVHFGIDTFPLAPPSGQNLRLDTTLVNNKFLFEYQRPGSMTLTFSTMFGHLYTKQFIFKIEKLNGILVEQQPKVWRHQVKISTCAQEIAKLNLQTAMTLTRCQR